MHNYYSFKIVCANVGRISYRLTHLMPFMHRHFNQLVNRKDHLFYLNKVCLCVDRPSQTCMSDDNGKLENSSEVYIICLSLSLSVALACLLSFQVFFSMPAWTLWRESYRSKLLNGKNCPRPGRKAPVEVFCLRCLRRKVAAASAFIVWKTWLRRRKSQCLKNRGQDEREHVYKCNFKYYTSPVCFSTSIILLFL